MKKIPYGIADFERVIREDYYYIDKSKYIRTVEEQNSYVLLVRPRRPYNKMMFFACWQAHIKKWGINSITWN